MSGFDTSIFDKPLEADQRAKEEPSRWRKYVVTPVNKFVCMFTGKK